LTVADGNPGLLFCAEGQLDLNSGSGAVRLEKLDWAVFAGGNAEPLTIKGKGTAFLISIVAI